MTSTATFLMRSLMYRQRFRNGQRRTCSLCRQGRPFRLSTTSGVLLPWGFLNGSHDKMGWLQMRQEPLSQESGALVFIPGIAIWFVFGLCFCVEFMAAVSVRCDAGDRVDADRDLTFPVLQFLTHFRYHFLHFQLSRIQE
jgi:hypothetical protein